MTEPKVSERMLQIVDTALYGGKESIKALLSAIAEIEQRAEAVYDCGTSSCLCGGLLEPLHGGQHTNGPCQCTPMQLRQAVVVARQRAEKWKEVAVAYQKWRDTYADDIADARLVAAIAALGDEWDEAVKGEASDGR